MSKNVFPIISSMTSFAFVLGVLLSTTCLSACAQPTRSVGLQQTTIALDSTLVSILGDSVCNVVFQATSAHCYRLSNVPLSDSDKRIGGFKVEQNLGKVSKEKLRIFQFLTSDGKGYLTGNNYPSVPFLPEVAMSFSKKKHTVDLVFSFAGGEMLIVVDGKPTKKVKYYNEREIMRFFQLLAQVPEWTTLLNLR